VERESVRLIPKEPRRIMKGSGFKDSRDGISEGVVDDFLFLSYAFPLPFVIPLFPRSCELKEEASDRADAGTKVNKVQLKGMNV